MSTLSDVAQRAGVSLATASRALNGSPGRTVRPELQARVEQAARELDYQPHAAAQTMARGRSNSLSLLVNDIGDPYFASIASGVASAASRFGCIVTLSSTGVDATPRVAVLNMLAAQRIRALIFAGGVATDDPGLPQLSAALRRLADRGTRVATIGAEQLGFASVVLPNTSGAEALATALLDLGHRSFSIIAGPDNRTSSSQRASAFADAVRSGGGTVAANQPSGFDRAAGYQAMDRLLTDPLPDVVFATNDLLALGALRRLREAGLRVPQDVALAGFGDSDALLDVEPGITSVLMDTEEAGRLAVEMTLGDNAQPRTEVLGFELRLRASTGRGQR